MKKTNILVTSIGSFSACAVIKSMKNAGCRVVGCDIHERHLLACGQDVDSFYTAPYYADNELYISSILKICENEKIEFVFPLTDAEIDVLNCSRELFDENGIIICMSGRETIELCRDKYKTYKYLREAKVYGLIETFRFSEIKNHKLDFPIIVKPCNGRSSNGVHILNSLEEVEFFKRICDSDVYIYQKKLEGNVITVDVCRDKKSDKTVCVAREELIRTGNGAGLSVRILNDAFLEKSAVEIARVLDVEGTVNFEYIKTTNGYSFIECNPRFSGGVAFSEIAGYDFALNALKYFKGEEIDNKSVIKGGYIVKKYVEIITKLSQAND